MKGILDIIIPHLNYEGLEIGLKSLHRNTPEGVINKVILIDACGNHPNLLAEGLVDRQIRTQNLGFAKAMNTGIRLSDNKFCMCANDDIIWLNKRWWQGILDTFAQISNALCVNPASVCDPDGKGGKVIMEGFEYKEDYDDATYDRLLEKGKGWVVDGICMWGPVFMRERLEQVKGIIPGKAWFDELFFPGGGEDYDLGRRAALSGFRCVGSNKSYVWHHWYSTKHPDSGIATVKFSGDFAAKWRTDDCPNPDIFGNCGRKIVPDNILRDI